MRSITLLAALAVASSPHAQSKPSGPTSELFSHRVKGHSELMKRSDAAARAVMLSLKWLVNHQSDDGRWSAANFMDEETSEPRSDGAGNPTFDVGVTALAVLALLADGNTPDAGRHTEAVASGIDWLIDQQDPKSGLIGTNASHEFIYGHSTATLALAEAWSMTQRDAELRAAVVAATGYLEKHRNPYCVWRYMPRDNDNDSSVTAWCSMALAAAKEGGIEIKKHVPQLIEAWYEQMTDPTTGRIGYTERGGRSSRLAGKHSARFPSHMGETNTAIGMYVRRLLNRQDENLAQLSATVVAASPPEWDPKSGAVDEYYWFFGSHAMRQIGGEDWDKWFEALTGALAENQRDQGNFSGSWDPVGPWAETAGRVYSTAMNTLALQSLYRSPTPEAPPAPKREPRRHARNR